VLVCLAVDAVAFRSMREGSPAGEAGPLIGLYLAIFVPLTAAIPALWYLVFVRRMGMGAVFLVAATVFGLLLLLVRTPYSWFDEDDHVYLAIYYSDVALGAEHGVTEDGRLSWVGRAEDANVPSVGDGRQFDHHLTDVGDYRLMAGHLFEAERDRGATATLTVEDVGVFYQYLPSALGVTVAHALHLGKVPTLYVAKLFSLAFSVLMVHLAVRAAPRRFKALFVLLGLVPFVLASAGTFSYDNTINVLAFLLVAHVLRLAYEAERVRPRDIVLLAVLGVLLAPLKYVYFPLLFLPVVIPKGKWPCRRFRLLWCGGILVLGLAAVGLFSSGQASGAVAEMTAGQSLSAAYPDSYTLRTFLAEPASALKVFGVSALMHLDLFVDLPSGFSFASRLPMWAHYLVFALLMLNASPAAGEEPLRMRRSARVLMLAIALTVYVLVLLASVSWTPVGSPLLAGAQGRYLVPTLPLLALSLYGLVRPAKALWRPSLYLFCCLGALDVFLAFVQAL
jgi:hypothetical protein